jgi:hypothetical protein
LPQNFLMMTSVISGIICFLVCSCIENKIIFFYICKIFSKRAFFLFKSEVLKSWSSSGEFLVMFWFWIFDFLCEDTSSVLQERKWESDTGFSLRCMKRQISSRVTTHIPQTVRSTTVIMLLLMYSGGLAVRNHNRRRSRSQFLFLIFYIGRNKRHKGIASSSSSNVNGGWYREWDWRSSAAWCRS